MFDIIKEYGKKILTSRLFALSVVMIILFTVLIQRIFVLQIINGEEYLNNYTLLIQKERVTSGTRGSIFDRNGKLLAYNELSYSVTIEDNGVYDSSKQKNKLLNQELSTVIQMVEEKGDSITNNFNVKMTENGKYKFMVSDKALQRFLADVYGHTKIEDLKYNKKLGYDEADAKPRQVIEFLQNKFAIHVEGSKSDDSQEEDLIYYSKEEAYKILVLRYAISQNSYQKYVQTTIAQNVSDETVAVIKENSDILQGVDITEDTVRKYVDSMYFSHIIGYTGKISQEEYETLSADSKNYSLNDVVGKSGIEQVMDRELQGTKGKESFYVDSVGRITEVIDRVESSSGNDIYLSIDAELQEAVYRMLEQELAGIVYANIENIKEYDTSSGTASDIKIPIDDVYFALINNNVLDIEHFAKDDAQPVEKQVYGIFQNKQSSVIEGLRQQFFSPFPTAYGDLDKEQQIYMSYILSLLGEKKIFLSEKVDQEDEVYLSWKNDTASLAEYLRRAIAMDWIDITGFDTESQYSDSTEIYDALITYIIEDLQEDQEFSKKIYRYMIKNDLISGTQICQILFEQGILQEEEGDRTALAEGNLSAFDFLRDKIKNLKITPAQLALDPCTASCVMIDVRTGELLACVTYPGYDTNRLANTVDSEYFESLQRDLSVPQYNNATQQRTAPGSTFKPITSAAALTEGCVSTEEEIKDEGEYTNITPPPKCWIYPGSTHGKINISEAIQHSCNYFFYELGYRLSSDNGIYNENKGIAALQKYAALFGLDEKTGIEIPENDPQISNEYPITSAIGQGNHNYTTTQLARYLTAVASSGNVYKLTLLHKETTSDGDLVKEFKPEIIRNITEVTASSWEAIQSGMRMVVENNKSFKDFQIAVAGKTGTAQQITTRANHALFIGYAPYENPEIAITTRIAHGYTSANAAEVSSNILKYYFNLADEKSLLDGQAEEIESSANGFTD
ncbi:MAG: peptidoglycan glycosyltransferase [Lachnospiraceae bacterium]|nr:peptidoglycan glycosyltransferase [Lachnospiraceae bacterium]